MMKEAEERRIVENMKQGEEEKISFKITVPTKI